MCNQDKSATSPFSPDKAKNFAKIFRCSSAYFFFKKLYQSAESTCNLQDAQGGHN